MRGRAPHFVAQHRGCTWSRTEYDRPAGPSVELAPAPLGLGGRAGGGGWVAVLAAFMPERLLNPRGDTLPLPAKELISTLAPAALPPALMASPACAEGVSFRSRDERSLNREVDERSPPPSRSSSKGIKSARSSPSADVWTRLSSRCPPRDATTAWACSGGAGVPSSRANLVSIK